MRKILYLVAIAALAVSVLVNTGYKTVHVNADEKPPSALEVKIENFAFTPPTLTVPAGTQVTWINKDDIPHNIVDKDHGFKSKALDTNEKFSYTFEKPGTYAYICSIHPAMTGKVIVK